VTWPSLVGVAHGSRNPAAQQTVEALLDAVQECRPELDVRVAYVELAEPDIPAVLAQTGPDAVVVPLLLSRGYHVAVDIGRTAVAVGARVAAPLGPAPALAAALADRLTEAGTPPDAPVVLAAAGSSDPAAVLDVEAQALLLAELRGTPVAPAYASAQSPTVHDAVADLLDRHRGPVAVAPYLLAPGYFATVVGRTAATWVSAPLGAHPALAGLVLERYLAAVPAGGASGDARHLVAGGG
jgi:sirohydrochlorin ferrochelatase